MHTFKFLGKQSVEFKAQFEHISKELNLDFARFSDPGELFKSYNTYSRICFLLNLRNDYAQTYQANPKAESKNMLYLFYAIAIESFYLKVNRESGKRLHFLMQCLSDLGDFCTEHQVNLPWSNIIDTLSDMSNRSHLHRSIKTNDSDFRRFIRDYDYIINNPNDLPDRPMHSSANNFILFMAVFIKRFKLFNVNKHLASNGNTLLMELASTNSGSYIMRNMLAFGADPEVKNHEGIKAIHHINLSFDGYLACMQGLHPSLIGGDGYDCDIFEKVNYAKEYYIDPDNSDETFKLHCTSFVDEIEQYERAVNKVGLLLNKRAYDYIAKAQASLKAIENLSDMNDSVVYERNARNTF